MIVDAHHHFWNLDTGGPALDDGRARRRSGARSSRPTSSRCSTAPASSTTVLVQAAVLRPRHRLHVRARGRHAWIGGVIAWIDLLSPGADARAARRARGAAEAAGLPPPHPRRARSALDPPGRRCSRASRSLRGAAADPRASLRLPAPSRRRARARRVVPRADDRDRPPRQAAARHRRDGRWAAALRARPRTANVAAKISGLNTMLPRPTGTRAICARRSPSRSSASGPTAWSAAATGRWRS